MNDARPAFQEMCREGMPQDMTLALTRNGPRLLG